MVQRYLKLAQTGSAGQQIDTGTYRCWTAIHSFGTHLAGTDFIVWADGANNATKYDGTTVTDISAAGAPARPAVRNRI